MLRSWLCGSLAITVEEIDFVDPALVDQPDVRERGVRLELRYVEIGTSGSVYVSPTLTLRPAVCRIDLLESRPHAADRMHWHPAMDAGEPDDRVFDTAMREDPLQWLGARLRNVDELLSRDADEQLVPDQRDADGIAGVADDIVAVVREGMSRMRQPWPVVQHDSRGLATVS